MKILLLFLVLNSYSLLSQEIMTIGEVYNYEIGDVIQTKYTNNPFQSYTTNRFLEKSFSQGNDTVQYVVEQAVLIPKYTIEFETTYNVDTIILSYTNLTDTLKLLQEPAQNYVDSCSNRMDTIYFVNQNSTCEKKIFEIKSFPLVENCFENPFYSEKYIAGLGKFDYFSGEFNGNFATYFTQVIYYKKGNVECGAYVTELSKLNNKNDFLISPNPATNFIEIKASQKIERIKIYSIEGNILINEVFQKDKISIENLNPGVYFLEILTDKNQISFQKFIKN